MDKFDTFIFRGESWLAYDPRMNFNSLQLYPLMFIRAPTSIAIANMNNIVSPEKPTANDSVKYTIFHCLIKIIMIIASNHYERSK